MTTPVKKCLCVGQHVPEVHALASHHILPKSWGGPDGPENRVVLCPSTHENVHQLLNKYVKRGGVPEWSVRRVYGVYARDLAARAWAQRPSDKPPYTVQAHALEESSG